MNADQPAADQHHVDIETLLLVYLDGMQTGAASLIGHYAKDMTGDEADLAAAAFLSPLAADPIALESLREQIRRRLRGDITPIATEVHVYGSE